MPGKTINEVLEDLKKEKELEKKEEFDKIAKTVQNSFYHSVSPMPPLSGTITTSTGTSIAASGNYTTYSGMANPNYTWVEPIKFGFTIRFKTTKAKLSLDWKEGRLTDIIGNPHELKKLL
jgi:hypothetical protein